MRRFQSKSGDWDLSGRWAVPGDELHQEKALADEKDDGKEKKERFPDSGSQRKTGVVSLAVVPQSGPAVEGDEAPEGIEERQDHEADRFGPIERGSEHLHHVPGAVKVRQAEDEPMDPGKTCQTKSDQADLEVRNLKGSHDECGGDNEGQD